MALQFAFGPNEAFFINSPRGAKASLNCPAPLREVLGGHYADSVRKIYRVTFSFRMECAAIYENDQGDLKFGVWDDGVNGANTFGEMSAWLNNYSQDLHTLRLTCGSDDSLVAVTNHGRQNRGLPPDLEAYLQTNEKTMKLHEVIIGYGGAWVVIWENGCFDFQLSGQYPALEAALVPLRHQMAVGAISYLSLNSFAPNQYVLILATSPQPSFQVLPGWEGLAHEFVQSWHMSLQQRNANPISQMSPAQNMSPIQRKPIQGTTLSNPQTAGPIPHTQPTQQQQFVSTPVAPPLQRVNTMPTTQPQPMLQEGGIPPQPHHNSISGPSPSTPIQLQNPSANLPSRPQSVYTMGSQTSAASIPSQNRRISTSSNSILRNVNSLVKTATPVVKKLATSAKNTVNNLNKPQQNQYHHQQSSQQQYQHQLQQQMQHQLHHQQQLLHHQQQQLQQFQQQQSQQNQQQQSLFGTSDPSQLQNQGFSIDPSQASQFWSSGQSQPTPSPQQTSSPFSIAQPAPLQPAPVFLQNSLLPDQSSFVDSNSVFGAANTGSGTVAWADTTTTTVTDNGSIMDVDTTQVDVSSYMDPNTGFVEQDVSVVDVNTQFDDSGFGGGDSGFGGDGGW